MIYDAGVTKMNITRLEEYSQRMIETHKPEDAAYGIATDTLELIQLYNHLVQELKSTTEALQDLAETNYNLAHQPANAFGKVIRERDVLRAENARLTDDLTIAISLYQYYLSRPGTNDTEPDPDDE